MIPGILAGGASSGPAPIPPSILDDDPLYPYVTVLLQGNGSNGGTVIIDQAGNQWTLYGDTQTDGSGAIVYAGSGDYATTTRDDALGLTDFTVDGKFRLTSLASDGLIFCISAAGGSLSSFNILIETKTSGALRCSIQDGSGGTQLDISTSASVLTTGVDYTFSFDVEGTAARIRIGGAVVASGTVSGTRVNSEVELRTGMLSAGSGYPRYLNGKLHWLRVTAGVVRNSGSGTVTAPSDPVPDWYAPVFASRFSIGSTNDSQSVCTDGTHVWVSSSTTIYKYTMAGSFVTSRDVSGDNPTGKSQINGLAIRSGVLYVCCAENSTPRKSWIATYDPTTLAYVAHNQIIGDWFIEGIDWKDGHWWAVFHANKVVAKINPSTWAVVDTISLGFPVTGSSGGYGAGTGYDGIAWIGGYLACNIHETYDQDECHVYVWNGASFDNVIRWRSPAQYATQGICLNPLDTTKLLFVERNPFGDKLATMTLT